MPCYAAFNAATEQMSARHPNYMVSQSRAFVDEHIISRGNLFQQLNNPRGSILHLSRERCYSQHMTMIGISIIDGYNQSSGTRD